MSENYHLVGSVRLAVGQREVTIPCGGFVGRAVSADLRLDLPGVSEYHLLFSLRPEGFVLLPLRGAVTFANDPVPFHGRLVHVGETFGLGAAPDGPEIRIVALERPLRVQELRWAGARVAVPDDTDALELYLCLDPPELTAVAGPERPLLRRSHGRVTLRWVQVAQPGRAPTEREVTLGAEEQTVYFGREARLVQLVERERPPTAPTVRRAALRIRLITPEKGWTEVEVHDSSRPGWEPARVAGKPGAFLARLLKLAPEGGIVRRDVAADGLWKGERLRGDVGTALSTIRNELGIHTSILPVDRAAADSVRVDLPEGSWIEMVDAQDR